jgi:carboxyl-terminal processing protease
MRSFPLPDGSLLWMVVAECETPCGRVIQREYRGVTLREYYPPGRGRAGHGGTTVLHNAGGRRVFGGGGIYPDRVLEAPPARFPWLSRIEASLVVTKWISGYLSQHPEIRDQRAVRDRLPDPARRVPR